MGRSRERTLNLTFQARVEGSEGFKKLGDEVRDAAGSIDDLNKKKLDGLLSNAEFNKFAKSLESLFALLNNNKLVANSLTTSMASFVDSTKGLAEVLNNETKSVEEQKKQLTDYVNTIDSLQKKLSNVKGMSSDQQKLYSNKINEIFNKDGLKAAEEYESKVLQKVNELQKATDKYNQALEKQIDGFSIKDRLKSYSDQLKSGLNNIDKIQKDFEIKKGNVLDRARNSIGIPDNEKGDAKLDELSKTINTADLLSKVSDIIKVYDIYSKYEKIFESKQNKPRGQLEALEAIKGMSQALNTFKEQWAELTSITSDDNILNAVLKKTFHQNFIPDDQLKEIENSFNKIKDQYINEIGKTKNILTKELNDLLGGDFNITAALPSQTEAKAEANSLNEIGKAAEENAKRIKELEKVLDEFDSAKLSNGQKNPLYDLNKAEVTDKNIARIKEYIEAYKEYLSLTKSTGLKNEYEENFNSLINQLSTSAFKNKIDFKTLTSEFNTQLSNNSVEVSIVPREDSVQDFIGRLQTILNTHPIEIPAEPKVDINKFNTFYDKLNEKIKSVLDAATVRETNLSQVFNQELNQIQTLSDAYRKLNEEVKFLFGNELKLNFDTNNVNFENLNTLFNNIKEIKNVPITITLSSDVHCLNIFSACAPVAYGK